MRSPSPEFREWCGVYAVAVTPFNRNLTVDYAGLRANIEFLVSQNSGPVVCLGSEAESYALSDQERGRVADVVAQAVHGRRPLIIGVSHPSAHQAQEDARQAAAFGADAVLATPPYFGSADEVAIRDHFSAIAESEIPVFLYNSPSRVGYDLQLSLIVSLLQIPGVVGIKQANIADLADLITAPGMNERLIVGGAESLMLPALVVGAVGNTATAASAIPAVFDRLMRETQQGHFDQALETFQRLAGLRMAYRLAGGQAPVVKHLMDELGLAGGFVRPPLRPIDPSLHKGLSEIISFSQGVVPVGS
jgi:4-hydroxy-tetrahydrodipicolinate synthase